MSERNHPRNLTIKLAFLKPFTSTSTVRLTLRPMGDTTHVTWTTTGPKTFMTRFMGGFMSMDKMLGPDFEKGLDKLKALVES